VRFAAVTNPGGRRSRLFADAVRAAGLPPVVEIPWRALAGGDVPVVPADALVRIDSPDGDAEVDRLLRGDVEPVAHGEIRPGAAWYAGFTAALNRLGGRLAGGGLLLSDPHAVAVMFDKRRCHAVLEAAGVPVPAALPPVTGYVGLRERMRAAGFGRVFVKPPHGSSASGVIALETAGPRLVATTSVEVADGRLYNSLTVRRYTDEATVAFVVDRLGPLHVERWFPKAGHGGRTVDLRVVVVAGRPTHVVVRASRHPMTNLHLGARRGDPAAVRAAAGEDNWRAAMETCARAAALFPGCLMVGVDLMFAPGWRRHAVAEVNAFGDLLPGLVNEHGRDTYAEQVHAALAGWGRGAAADRAGGVAAGRERGAAAGSEGRVGATRVVACST
jgi:glutathione synthase/RimK-type ligase-like ATP-grasp enzyme